MYFIYLVMAIYFPAMYNIQPAYLGANYLLIGGAYLVGGLLGHLSAAVSMEWQMAGRLGLPWIMFIISVATNFMVGWFITYAEYAQTVCTILLCAFLRGVMLPGAISYCVDLQRQEAKSVLDGIATLQLIFSVVLQAGGASVDMESLFVWVFGVISGLMLLCCIPVTLFLFRRLFEKAPLL
jgi:hypothetical protein